MSCTFAPVDVEVTEDETEFSTRRGIVVMNYKVNYEV